MCNYSFSPSWRMIILTVLVMSLFIRLGYWQLHRADEKRQLLSAYQRASKQVPQRLLRIPLPKQYQRVYLEGHYLPIILLLDNQHHDHQYGYEVLSPMVLENGDSVIVDRGWVKGDPSRQHWPVLTTPIHKIKLSGQIYYPPGKSWLLGSGFEVKRGDLAIIETLDIAMMRQFLHKSLYPFIIRQSPDSPGGYVCDWPIVASTPERHMGYAIQWFLFACIAGILWVILNVKKKYETT